MTIGGLALSGTILIFFLWLAWRFLRGAIQSLDFFWNVVRARRNHFNNIKPGPVALIGKVVSMQPLISEETGRKGVYLAYSADKWQAPATTSTGIVGQWLRAEQGEQAVPFEITDGNHLIKIDPHQATFLAPNLLKEFEYAGDRIRYSETLIEEGAEVLVIGQAEVQGGFEASSEYRGHSYQIVVAGKGKRNLEIVDTGGVILRATIQMCLRLSLLVLNVVVIGWLGWLIGK